MLIYSGVHLKKAIAGVGCIIKKEMIHNKMNYEVNTERMLSMQLSIVGLRL